MIFKFFEIEKINLKEKKFFLFYGDNQGHKNEIISSKFKKNYPENYYNYEESEILNNEENFFNNIFSKSFFENEKLIIINRASDKIKDLIEEILEKKIDDLVLILNANSLEKKSKLRTLFEKNKKTVTVAFYEDNNQTLSKIASNFFKKIKTPISQQSLNLIVERCRGDRQNLNIELQKIQSFAKGKNKIDISDLLKLTNLAENYDVSELIDNCLSKNRKKTINILNENNYSLEDCILIIRTFLIKAKRLVKLNEDLEQIKNIDSAISNFKPPIFWKDKDIVKKQIKYWSNKDSQNLIYEINKIELLIKRHSNNSVNILSDFIIEQASPINN